MTTLRYPQIDFDSPQSLPFSNPFTLLLISSNILTPRLPNAVPTPTAVAPTALILLKPAPSLTPPIPIIDIPLNASFSSHIFLNALTFPKASGCKGVPANPPTPLPSPEFRVSLNSEIESDGVRRSDDPNVFVAVINDIGTFGAKGSRASRIMVKFCGFV